MNSRSSFGVFRPNEDSGHLLARNVFLNIVGQGLPILIAFFSIPVLIRQLGTEKFGVLALAWVLAGYFNLFDLGLGRAIVRIVVQKIPSPTTELFQAVWSSFVIATTLGICGGATLFFSAEWLAVHFFAVDDELHAQVLLSLQVMGVAIPFVVSSTIFRGILEAFQKFAWINYVQVPIGSLTYLLPLIVSLFTQDLPWIIATLVLLRLNLWVAFLHLCYRLLHNYPRQYWVQLVTLKELLSFGFWITTSNLIQPFLSYLDRFLIGSLVSVVAVAYYTAPMEVVLKLWVLPGAVISVIYPAFAALQANSAQLKSLFDRSTKFLIIVLAPICITLSVMAEDILRVWISAEYAESSGVLLRILSLGIFMNCLGFVPAAFLQAIGRPSIPAKLHVFEFPAYALTLFLSLKLFGLPGAAAAWFLRVTVDAICLQLISAKMLGLVEWFTKLLIATALVFGFVIWVGQLSFAIRLGFVGATVFAFPIFGWYFILSVSDQRYLLRRLLKFLVREEPVTNIPRREKVEKVGVAMAVFNPDTQLFLNQIRSLKNQTFENWHCVATFDSPIKTIFEDAQLKAELDDPRFQLVENQVRKGATRNFQEALMQVQWIDCDAVAFCDQDDEWYPEKLAHLVDALNRCPEGSLVHCDMKVVSVGSSPGSRSVVKAESAWRHEDRQVDDQARFHFLIRNCVTGAASLMDIRLAKSFAEIPLSFQFHDHWYALVASCHGGVYPLKEVLYNYVQHGRNAVGVVPFKGIFYRPPGLTLAEMRERAVAAWLETVDMAKDLESQGLSSHLSTILKDKSSVRTGFLLILVGLLHLRADSPLSRSCLIKGIGGILNQVR